jgi:O-antigen chain-terminating methyltransferase
LSTLFFLIDFLNNTITSNHEAVFLHFFRKHSAMNTAEEITITQLMAELRDRVKRECKLTPMEGLVPFSPGVADIDSATERKAGELRDSEHLRFLNLHHARVLGLSAGSIQSHRTGLAGRFVVAIKRRLMVWLADLLKEHQQQEIEYRAHLVRYLNQVASYGDARDSTLFWELIHKIDTDVTNAVRRIEAIYTEGEANRYTLECTIRDLVYREIGTLREQGDLHSARIGTVERVVEGLERIIASIAAKGESQTVSSTSSKGKAPIKSGGKGDVGQDSYMGVPNGASHDYSYLLLENRFRGSEELIKSRVTRYVDKCIEQSVDTVLEIGCGRGELLEGLREKGIDAQGIDLDAAMVQRCNEKGLNVQHGDGIAYLQGQPDGTLGGVIAIQVVEHLRLKDLQQLISLCARKVRVGGVVIFETINPQSVVALSSNYFRDPTHIWPLHSDTLSYLMQLGGLENMAVSQLSPFPKEATLQLIENEEFFSPRWQRVVHLLNSQLTRLNDLLYGFQDYCITATVPAPK